MKILDIFKPIAVRTKPNTVAANWISENENTQSQLEDLVASKFEEIRRSRVTLALRGLLETFVRNNLNTSEMRRLLAPYNLDIVKKIDGDLSGRAITIGVRDLWNLHKLELVTPEMINAVNKNKVTIIRELLTVIKDTGSPLSVMGLVRNLKNVGIDWPELDIIENSTKPRLEESGDESTMTVESDGDKLWRNSAGQLHREDGPAIIYPDGYQGWYHDGKLHREDGPAVTEPDGSQYWYQNDRLHREDGPAVVWPSGTMEWWHNGKNITKVALIELARAGDKATVLKQLLIPIKKYMSFDQSLKLIKLLKNAGIDWPEFAAIEKSAKK